MRSPLLAVLLIGAGLLSACGGGLTLEEYGERCAGLSADVFANVEEGISWGDLSEILASGLAEVEDVSPPSEVARWHRSAVSFLERAQEIVEEQEPSEEAELRSLLDPGLVRAGLRLQRETEDLSAAAAAALSASGCLPGE